ncbi:hypothetical protein QJS66_10540 [Kocuria rhizophila]|nr:hypothetical protein QJS66_10540 [Kocuria rhizophila]
MVHDRPPTDPQDVVHGFERSPIRRPRPARPRSRGLKRVVAVGERTVPLELERPDYHPADSLSRTPWASCRGLRPEKPVGTSRSPGGLRAGAAARAQAQP